MPFIHAKAEVYNRGRAPDDFLDFIVDWAVRADNSLFDYNDAVDAYSHVNYKLGPWKDGSEFLTHRRAVMLEILRTLCGFESSWNWQEDLDATGTNSHGQRGRDRPESQWEAGILQISADSMSYKACADYAAENGIGRDDAARFRQLTRTRSVFPIQYGVLLLRATYKHHGPLRRRENDVANPQSSSIHPYLSKESVSEFERHILARS